jgi:hypothetical protein
MWLLQRPYLTSSLPRLVSVPLVLISYMVVTFASFRLFLEACIDIPRQLFSLNGYSSRKSPWVRYSVMVSLGGLLLTFFVILACGLVSLWLGAKLASLSLAFHHD